MLEPTSSAAAALAGQSCLSCRRSCDIARPLAGPGAPEAGPGERSRPRHHGMVAATAPTRRMTINEVCHGDTDQAAVNHSVEADPTAIAYTWSRRCPARQRQAAVVPAPSGSASAHPFRAEAWAMDAVMRRARPTQTGRSSRRYRQTLLAARESGGWGLPVTQPSLLTCGG